MASLIYSEDMALIEAGLGALKVLHCDCSSYTQQLTKLSTDSKDRTELVQLIQLLLMNVNIGHKEL